jgi:hypothetical protein
MSTLTPRSRAIAQIICVQFNRLSIDATSSDQALAALTKASAATPSAVEGIRAPFSKGKHASAPTSTAAFIVYWKRRVGATAR